MLLSQPTPSDKTFGFICRGAGEGLRPFDPLWPLLRAESMPSQKPNLSARLTFRLPETVAEDWRRQADRAGLSLSDFVRAAVDTHQATGIAPPGRRRASRSSTPADPALVRQIAWIGNNLNQVARWANRNNGSSTAAEVVQVLVHLSAMSRALDVLLRKGDRAH